MAIPEEMWAYIRESWAAAGGLVASPGEALQLRPGDASAEVVLDSEEEEEGGEAPRVLVELEEAAEADRECGACLQDSHASGQQEEGAAPQG